MESPLVSIVMPTYNQARYIRMALASIILQEFPDWELIVVMDGCTDDTLSHVEAAINLDERISYISYSENKGTAHAINQGIEEARGDYWTWVSSDNEMSRDWLAKLVPVMQEGEGMGWGMTCGAVYSGFNFNYCNLDLKVSKTLYSYQPHAKHRLIQTSDCYYGPSFLIRDYVWKEAGPHRGRLGHDYDHWARVEEVCYNTGLEIRSVNEALCEYYSHPARAGKTQSEGKDSKQWQKEAIQRREDSGF